MPPTATLEQIKAHQDRVEKDKITPDNLPACPRCFVETVYFKLHAYRERRFLIIIGLWVQAAYCSLVRFICPGCGKTFTHYPDFAIPHKHYTQPSITGFCARYVESDAMSYQRAVMVDGSVPAYPQADGILAPSTVHRWITQPLGDFPRPAGRHSRCFLRKFPHQASAGIWPGWLSISENTKPSIAENS
jgi:hypothetical protein